MATYSEIFEEITKVNEMLGSKMEKSVDAPGTGDGEDTCDCPDKENCECDAQKGGKMDENAKGKDY